MTRFTIPAFLLCSLLGACGDDDGNAMPPDGGGDASGGPDAAPFAQRVYVAHEGSLVSYDVASGAEQPGACRT